MKEEKDFSEIQCTISTLLENLRYLRKVFWSKGLKVQTNTCYKEADI